MSTPTPKDLAEAAADLIAQLGARTKELAQAAMVSKLASDHLGGFGRNAKIELQQLMVATGSTQQRVLAADKLDMGCVSLVGGKAKATVTDFGAFLAWAIANHPGEVVQVPRESFVKAMLARADQLGEPVDPAGLVMDGIEYVEGEPYLTVRPTSAAKVRMADLLGEAEWMRQLPAGTVRPEPAPPAESTR